MALDEKSVTELRKEHFPSTRDWVQLKAAGGSPLCRYAREEVDRYNEEIYLLGDLLWDRYLEKVEEVRIAASEYFGAEPGEIAFLFNTSSAMHSLIPFIGRKGRILMPQHEFPVSTLPYLFRGYEIDFLKDSGNRFPPGDFEKNITDETGYIHTSHVQYFSGFRQDLEKLGEIAAQRGLTYIVNATQSFGAFQVDVKKCRADFLVASALKWACSGYGISVLYIRDGIMDCEDLPDVLPACWLSVEGSPMFDNLNTRFVPRAKSLDALGGAPHFSGIFSLGGSLRLIKEVGIENIESRILFLSDYAIENLKKRKKLIITPAEKPFRSGIVTFEQGNADFVRKEMEKRKILVSCRCHPQGVEKKYIRMGIHYFNTIEDLDRFFAALDELDVP